MDPEQFGRFLSEERKSKNLTQKELAEKLGVTDKAISKWERGVCLPDVAKFDDIAAALGVTDVEVLRAHRLPPEEAKAEEKAPPFVTWRELGRVLLACFVVTLVCFVCNLLEDWKAMPFHIYGLARLLQVVFCAAASVWLAVRAAGSETRGDYRGALRYTLILAAVVAAAVVVLGNHIMSWFFEVPAKLFGINYWDDRTGDYMPRVWYQQYLDGAWTPKLLLFMYLSFDIFDYVNLQGLLLAFASYPFAKLLRIRRNGKKQTNG